MTDFRKIFEEWKTNPFFDEETRKELSLLTDEKVIEDRFYTDLEFGTGGLRGVMGAGTNRMNKYTVGKATYGLGLYLLDTFGKDRKISFCRELTKLNEEIMRTTLGEAVVYYEAHEPRGEYVLVLEGAAEAGVDTSIAEEANTLLSLTPEEHVSHYEKEGLPRMDAIKRAANDSGL